MCGLFTTPPNRPFNVAFPAEKRDVLSGRLRELFDRPFKVVFPCGKAGCAFDNCITHALLSPFSQSKIYPFPLRLA